MSVIASKLARRNWGGTKKEEKWRNCGNEHTKNEIPTSTVQRNVDRSKEFCSSLCFRNQCRRQVWGEWKAREFKGMEGNEKIEKMWGMASNKKSNASHVSWSEMSVLSPKYRRAEPKCRLSVLKANQKTLFQALRANYLKVDVIETNTSKNSSLYDTPFRALEASRARIPWM